MLALFRQCCSVESESNRAGATQWSPAGQWSAAGQRFGYQRRYSVEINSSVCLPDVLPTWSTPHGIIIHIIIVIS